eukprot:976010-Lingulodinium_polyedra.AAC.1
MGLFGPARPSRRGAQARWSSCASTARPGSATRTAAVAVGVGRSAPGRFGSEARGRARAGRS